jgi:hypothetical protein
MAPTLAQPDQRHSDKHISRLSPTDYEFVSAPTKSVRQFYKEEEVDRYMRYAPNLGILRERLYERRTMKIASRTLTLANRDCDFTDVKDGLAIAARVPRGAARSAGMIPKAKSLSSHGRRL